ncbi:putative RNA polymerase II transcriptional coactivator isoform X1 [Strongylocentrotus purpuratus]|uniref:Transcriptional coactivator p15 (PC4) C-terminal domain-containing protein n=1 Tax=Strongylocentrotus purpuratus TaxID=7668 RepID=A0A7M7PL38_STRPU|nr:putative RNA polymerase II transcriptional coactivator isoform X1 [Strongylocentrotus purpuratus]XP_030849008.1 putative RNA polymerase II transcriptional coactivator isoform X1 [Strongylocentrotus purpuratus]XP_030852698.1 putative RNA polymerase II transcriptional coactivator isoform X1 [Strongylocentrotus purpuratus]|eukprot:XP_001179446.2 PREDICTED: putative RNA polymerase II transcriptional coactivator [Strongylocentrotus purpuratus]
MMATRSPKKSTTTTATIHNTVLNTPKVRMIPENNATNVLHRASFSMSPVEQKKLKPATPPEILAMRAQGDRKCESWITGKEEAGCHFSQEIINVEKCKFEAGSKPFHLGGKRFAVVKKFRGVPYVNIREYYNTKGTNRMLPGQKGINLTGENWWKLVKAKFEISDAVRDLSNVKK